MKLTKIITAVAVLIAVQSSNLFAQKPVGFSEVEKLYNEKKFTTVLSVIDPVIARNNSEEALLRLYYMRGSSRFNAIYQARTGNIFGSDTVFDEKRPRFELQYNDNFIKLLDGAIGDLKKAYEVGSANLAAKKEDSGFAYRFKTYEFEVRKIEALTYLEKAQFVTNTNADFLRANLAFDELEPIYLSFGGPTTFADFSSSTINFKQGEMIGAEIRSKMALGKINDSLSLFDKWMKAGGVSVKKEIAVSSMVEAFDMVGNYKYTDAFLIREAIRQITIDKGKVVPTNFTLLKAAMKSHLFNLNFAVAISPTDKLLPLQQARLASAYNFKPNRTPAETLFIKNAPDVIKANKNTPPLDTQLNSLLLSLQSTDKKEATLAKKTLEEMSKKEGSNAAILAVRGYSKMLSEDLAGAETDLSAAIKKDPFLAFAHGAFENRATVYKKLGKLDLAAKDEAENSRFKRLLAFLAAA